MNLRIKVEAPDDANQQIRNKARPCTNIPKAWNLDTP
jgi:hypothetical protein